MSINPARQREAEGRGPELLRFLDTLVRRNQAAHFFETLAHFFGNDGHIRMLGELQHRHRVHEADRHRAAGVCTHHHIARQQQPNIRLGSKRTVCQWRIAGTEDDRLARIATRLGLVERSSYWLTQSGHIHETISGVSRNGSGI